MARPARSPTSRRFAPVKAIEWRGGVDGECLLLDQTLLPARRRVLRVVDLETMGLAIRRLAVRGAPAIGIAAAYGVVLGVRTDANRSSERFESALRRSVAFLERSRPTAVNLFWALRRMNDCARTHLDAGRNPARVLEILLKEAKAIHREDEAQCEAIGRYGKRLLGDGAAVLTHCNAGALATGGIGTALAPIYAAARAGRSVRVFADETRPLLQGARLTAWELAQAGIEVTLICDGAAARVIGEGKVHCAIVGADRIAANGDTANKIGTYGVALAARSHGVPFYVAAPSNTFDLSIKGGGGIPIEERDPSELLAGSRAPALSRSLDAYNPAFDVTPARLVSGFITERGIIRPPFAKNIPRVLGKKR